MLTHGNSDALYRRLLALIASTPDDLSQKSDPRVLGWLGEAYALVHEVGEAGDAARIRQLSDSYSFDDGDRTGILLALYRSLSRAGIHASSQSTSAFIAAGKAFDGFATLAKILYAARSTALLIDPYADASLITEFAVLVPQAAKIRILAEKGKAKPALKPAVEKWIEQYGQDRPIELRLAPKDSMHDRLMLIDDKLAYMVSQSFANLATRSPAAILPLEGDLLAMKRAHYEDLWQQGA